MDFLLNNNNSTLVNNNTKLLRWSLFLNIHYSEQSELPTGWYLSLWFWWMLTGSSTLFSSQSRQSMYPEPANFHHKFVVQASPSSSDSVKSCCIYYSSRHV